MRCASLRVCAIVAAMLAAPALPARAERLVLSLSTHRVAIGSNYTGAQLVLFGIVERDAQSTDRPAGTDIVVVVRGPRESLTVRRKESVGPVWINRGQQKFAAVPAVLGVFSSRPLDDIADPHVRSRLRLGLDEIVRAPEFALESGDPHDLFRTALVRLKRRDGLWSENGRGAAFVTNGFFRAPLPLPGTAPTGNYDVEAIILSGGTVVARREVSFEVVKAGLEEQITSFAQDRTLTYGFLVVAMSLGFGWLASVIFRRD